MFVYNKLGVYISMQNLILGQIKVQVYFLNRMSLQLIYLKDYNVKKLKIKHTCNFC